MTLISEPPVGHPCGPNRRGIWLDEYMYDRVGTVRACTECGRTWVAYRLDYDGYVGVRWRSEGWFARWRRSRREAKR